MTTEYPANGSFSDHIDPPERAGAKAGTRSVHEAYAGRLRVRALKGSKSSADRRKFEFLMVKLLRVYGECLGARSR